MTSTNLNSPRIVFLTAGAAGMYCGSCMNDNAVAKALIGQGVQCLLQPIYTPIRTDQISVASDQVFFGGIEVYLTQKFKWARHLPAPLLRLLNSPWLIRLATRRSGATDPKLLGELATSMLRGSDGNQAAEVERLVHWLADEIKPDAIVLSNLLIGGALPEIRKMLPDVRIAVMLQGDDIFLEHLPEPHQSEAIELCRSLVQHADYFVTHSQFYADKMGQQFQIPDAKRVQLPLTIDTAPFEKFSVPPLTSSDTSFKLGYLARIAPEKGLHHLVDAFLSLANHAEVELHVAGWLGEHNHQYFNDLKSKIETAGLSDRFVHHGSPSLEEKIGLLHSFDVLSVPTVYHEPKGLFVLESLAAGVPVVQPDHGAFGELIAATDGGLTYPPGDSLALVERFLELKQNAGLRKSLGQSGRRNVVANHNADASARKLIELLGLKPKSI